MIKVVYQPEPRDFDINVRQKGRKHFATHPYPRTSKEWEGKDYWVNALDDLYDSYSGICSYCAEWIPKTTGDPTVDHFIPKSIDPNLAYEWSNFRLACLRFNRAKKTYTDILDPFEIEPEWFILHFPSLQVLANRQLPDEIIQKIETTIMRLKLRDDRSIDSRKRWVIDFCKSDITFSFLKRHAPFIAFEIERQGILNDLPKIMNVV